MSGHDQFNDNFDQHMYTGKDEGSINIEEPDGRYKIEISSKREEAKWHVTYNGHPKPQLIWYDNFGREILRSGSNDKLDKYEVEVKDDHTLLKIRRLELKDNGEYTLRAFNGLVEAEKKFQLVVKGTDFDAALIVV